MAKTTIDKDLQKISSLEMSSRTSSRWPLAFALVFLLLIWGLAFLFTDGTEGRLLIVLAAVLGGYMALNIGANDVANNMGPAVGSRALSIGTALVIAALFEAAGAILAGADVVDTVSRGIVATDRMPSPEAFSFAMTAALLAGALWLNLATWLGAPVSTTHAIVGGVIGAGMAVAGPAAVDWNVMGGIIASWIISPVLGGFFAVVVLAVINAKILISEDKIGAAKIWVPLLLAVMASSFAAYLALKGLNNVWRPSLWQIAVISIIAFFGALVMLRPIIARQAFGLPNRRRSVNQLFIIPLICAAALLSFAHGANDVANAIGPLAAIYTTASSGTIESKVAVPLWIMLIGAAGISAGLALFGPRLIRMVGEKITKLNPVRAYCVALSAAVTVIAASALGLPVSSTHIAVGAVFGVGFYREHVRHKRRDEIAWKAEAGNAASEAVLVLDFSMHPSSRPSEQDQRNKAEEKAEKRRKRKLVRRSHFLTIIAAWVITVPVTAVLSGFLYLAINWVV